MIRVFKCYPKRGSVILVVIGVFVVLLISLASFLKSSISRVYTTKRLGDKMLAREFANSLAVLSNHYIKNKLLKNTGSNLRLLLSKTLNSIKSGSKEVSTDITLELENEIKKSVKNSSGDLFTLFFNKSKEGLSELDWKLHWIVNRNDFHYINEEKEELNPYFREKIGIIRVYIKISYVLPGNKNKITEDYLFVTPIKVVANALPLLSKFTLYIDDALDGDTRERFNVVETDKKGDVISGSVKPWVLDNGANSVPAKDKYSDVINEAVGLVYIGGGNKAQGDTRREISLGLARGFGGENSKYGEDLHFYKKGSSGYWKNKEFWGDIFGNGKNCGISVANIGLCSEKDDWREQLGAVYAAQSKYNSIFRLMGTDKAPSPTIVLGYVNSKYASVKMFMNQDSSNPNKKYIEFLQASDEEHYYYRTGISQPDPQFDMRFPIYNFYTSYLTKHKDKNQLSYDEYITQWSSNVEEARYNIGYVQTKNRTAAWPIKDSAVDQELKNLCDKNSDSVVNVPRTEKAKYDKVYTSASTLQNNFSNFIDVDFLSINPDEAEKNRRIAHFVKVKDKGDLEVYLKKYGFLRGKKLDLNGWCYVKNETGASVKFSDWYLLSSGGIIVDTGGIRIENNIDSDSDNHHLTVLALEGDITIAGGAKKLYASLVSRMGQVELEGNGDPLEVHGNIVMKKIKRGDIKARMGRGLNLHYIESLAAWPKNEGNDHTEEKLLMFDFEESNLKMFN